jgi:tetratricopeptide (TPR) repeat protein
MKNTLKERSLNSNIHTRFDFFIGFSCGLLLLSQFYLSFFPASRLWGINHLAYFPLWVRLFFTLAGLLVLLPWVNSKTYKLFDEFLSLIRKRFTEREVLGYAFFSIIFIVFFWLMRARTHFLGDGYAVISHLESEQYLRIGFEPFEIFSHLYLYKFLKLFFLPSAEFVYAGSSVLAGGVFVFILFFFTKVLSEDKFDRLLIFSVIIFSGATELFLGYAEHYTLLYVSIFAYLYFSLRYLQGKTEFFLPIFFSLLSLGFHLSSVYLLPSLVFLFIAKKREEGWIFSIKRAVPLIFIMIPVAGFFIYYIWGINPVLSEIFVPVFKGRPYAANYILFSFPHILDILNQHLLLSSAGIILLLVIILTYKGIIKFKDPIVSFLVIVSITQLFYHFLVDPKFGAPRDWDLFSSIALGYTLLGVYLFINFVQSKRYSALVIIFLSILTALPWFLLNANTEKGINRFRNILDLDSKRSWSGRYTLADYFYKQKNFVEYKETLAQLNKAFPEDSLVRKAETYKELGELDKTTDLLKKAIEINPSFFWAYNDLGVIYLKQGKADQALDEFEKVVRLNPYSFIFHVNMGRAFLAKGELQKALAEFNKARKLGCNLPDVYCDVAIIYSSIGETEKAIRTYDQVLQSNPDYAPAHYGLGLICSQIGLREKAIEDFELFLRYSQDNALKEQVKTLVIKLRSQQK